MPRGFGRKAKRTKKCHCEAPWWSVWEICETAANELVITLECSNCHALWDTRSRQARRYADPDALIRSDGKRTYGDVFKAADESRKASLKHLLANRQSDIEEIRKKMDEMQRELDFLEAAPLIPEE